MVSDATPRSLHLGAGRQSTTIALLVAQGLLPKPDHVLFSDTGNEPDVVYEHLQRIEGELLTPAGVPLTLVSHGDLAEDVLNPHVFATIPAYTLELVPQQRGWLTWNERKEGRQERHCTSRYKIEPLQREERRLLGARVREVPCKYCDATGDRIAPWNAGRDWAQPGPCSVCRGTAVRTLVDEVPKGAVVEVWIGFDATEAVNRINDSQFAPYQHPRYPLLNLPRPPQRIAEDRHRLRRHSETGWTTADCLWYLHEHGWPNVPKSACKQCPNRSNAGWRHMRDNDPESFRWAVDYDRQLRTAPGMRSQRFLHEDRVPLDEANLDRPSAAELRAAQGDLFDELAAVDFGGCSPHGCQTDLAEGAAAGA